MNMNSKWEECTKKIPQKDEFSLEGIETWHISKEEMIPNYPDIGSPLFREETLRLIACGFDIGFNTDNGVGHIHVMDGEFVIELWQYMKKTRFTKTTLDEVIDWLKYFYDNNCLLKKKIGN